MRQNDRFIFLNNSLKFFTVISFQSELSKDISRETTDTVFLTVLKWTEVQGDGKCKVHAGNSREINQNTCNDEPVEGNQQRLDGLKKTYRNLKFPVLANKVLSPWNSNGIMIYMVDIVIHTHPSTTTLSSSMLYLQVVKLIDLKFNIKDKMIRIKWRHTLEKKVTINDRPLSQRMSPQRLQYIPMLK